ncbi:hypothetical protein [Sphingomonas aerophila]|uniref:Uncharacterized protein n=1 Tax=Sphingomonas aerophila TaxID=1344948 RepID=A0A7W9EW32_9SPHN|nr:hypothetical protein [Sphingomonas aerophila]MBB5716871.1 hypothetical protein [Sphingomonas aerophila]
MTLADIMAGQTVEATSPSGTSGRRRVAVDAHVHLRGDVTMNLRVAADNFATAGSDVGAVLLTDSEAVDTFETLYSAGLPHGICETGEAISLMSQLGIRPVLLVAGCQVVTAERVEVLLIGTRRKLADGLPLEAVLRDAEERDVLAILPWGLGKWVGTRGKLVVKALERHRGVMVGDIPARPRAFRSALLSHPRRLGRRVLSGTDPLPLPKESNRIGTFGQIVSVKLNPIAPAASLIAALRSPETALETYGRRQSLVEMAGLQWALRRENKRLAA